MRIIDAVWEKRNFGVDTAELIPDEKDTLASITDAEKNLPQDTKYLVLKTPINRSDLLFGLTQNGWTFVEAQETIQLKRENYSNPMSLSRFQKFCSWRLAQTLEDAQQVLSHYKTGSFRTDRVALDPHFGEKVAGIRYYRWGIDVFQQGGEIFECLFREKSIGSFIFQPDKKIPHLNHAILGAMLPEYQEKGLGSLFFQCNMDAAFDRGTKIIQTAISSNNLSVFRLWLMFGAELLATHYVYIKHRTK